MSSVVSCKIEDDPFYDLDEDRNLQEVIDQVMLPDACSVHRMLMVMKMYQFVLSWMIISGTKLLCYSFGSQQKTQDQKKMQKLKIKLLIKPNLSIEDVQHFLGGKRSL